MSTWTCRNEEMTADVPTAAPVLPSQAQTSRCLQASTTARLAQSYVMEKLSCLSVNIMMDGRDSNYSKLQLLAYPSFTSQKTSAVIQLEFDFNEK